MAIAWGRDAESAQGGAPTNRIRTYLSLTFPFTFGVILFFEDDWPRPPRGRMRRQPCLISIAVRSRQSNYERIGIE
jgi:hypothetical protein